MIVVNGRVLWRLARRLQDDDGAFTGGETLAGEDLC